MEKVYLFLRESFSILFIPRVRSCKSYGKSYGNFFCCWSTSKGHAPRECTFSRLDESEGAAMSWLATLVSSLVQKPTIKQGSQERVGSIDTSTGSSWILLSGKNCKSPLLLVVKPLDFVFRMYPSFPSWLGLFSLQVLCSYCLSPHSSPRITNPLLLTSSHLQEQTSISAFTLCSPWRPIQNKCSHLLWVLLKFQVTFFF